MQRSTLTNWRGRPIKRMDPLLARLKIPEDPIWHASPFRLGTSDPDQLHSTGPVWGGSTTRRCLFAPISWALHLLPFLPASW